MISLIRILIIIGLIIINLTLPFELLFYIRGYPFLPVNLIVFFATYYPYVLVALVLLEVFSTQLANLFFILLLLLITSFYIKVFTYTNCAICAFQGFLPTLDIKLQLCIFALALLFSLYEFYILNFKNDKNKK